MFIKLNLTKLFKTARRFFLLIILNGFIFATLCLLNVSRTSGQTNSSSSSVKGGKAVGTYTLDNFDNINLFNGNLNFNLPLITLNGRGENGISLFLAIETRWKLVRAPIGQTEYYYYEPEMLAGPIVNSGTLIANVSTYQNYETNPDTCGQADTQPRYGKLTLTFTSSNGTSYQLRSTQNNGAPYFVPYCYPGLPGINHGTEFISWDGSGVKFISDTPVRSMVESFGNLNGYLLFPSGTRYRINSGILCWAEDRNGNRTTFWAENSVLPDSFSRESFYPSPKIVDSNGREIDFQYDLVDSTYGAHTKVLYKGFGGSNRIIRVTYKDLQDVLRPDQSFKSIGELFPNAPGNQSTDYPFLRVVSDLWLPDGRKYSFLYTSYGQLARVTLPTGGTYEYDYTPYSLPQPGPFPIGVPYIRVSERRTYADGVNLSQKIVFNAFLGGTTVDTYQPDGQRISRSMHYFHGSPIPLFPTQGLDVFEDEEAWDKGREYKTENYASDGTTLLRNAETQWEIGRYAVWNPYGTGITNVYRDARIASKTNFLADSGQISKTVYGYDPEVIFNLQNDVYEYDYGAGHVGSFIRRSHTEYEKNSIYLNKNLRALPKETWISADIDGENIVSRTRYEYDNYTNGTYTAPLLERSNITGHNPAYGINYLIRGNITKVSTYAEARNRGGEVSVRTQYDIAGNIVRTFDARGNDLTINYNDNFGSADAEARNDVSDAIPNLSGGQETFAFATSARNSAGFVTYAQFDYYLGAGVDSEDINGVVSTTFYNDLLDRPTQTIDANNRPNYRRRTICVYDDIGRKVTVKTDSKTFGDQLIKNEAYYDGLGRTFETRNYENAADYTAVLTEFDALGRAYKSSSQYRPYMNEQPHWTITSYDALGRISEIKSPDNGKIRREYWGTSVRIFDQANRSRAGVSDALGRLKKVVEYDDGADLETFYTFDVLGRLHKIVQGGQSRYFMYDDLGRLIRAKQPEQNVNSNLNLTDPITGNSVWSVKYEYDNNGNLISTTDSRNFTMTGTYDNLNRLTARNYSDATPDVTFIFDNPEIPNSKGRLTSIVSSDSSSYYTAFDELGRIKSSAQMTGGQTFNFPNYTYDLSGTLVEQTYPSGRIVKAETDNIGRLSRVTSQNPNQVERTYLSHLSYTAFGAINQARLGNGRWESAQFDPKTMQVVEIGLGYSPGNTSQLKIEYNYGTTTAETSNNNGSMRQQKITYSGQNSPIIQNYTYDMLNRLKSATEKVNDSQTWKQTFLYDRYGNRRFDAANTTTLAANNGTYNPNIDPNTNRFLAAEGYNYDSEGNLTANPESQLFQYDADNRQIRVTNTATQRVADYYYDGAGKRVRKVIGEEETIFVYDAFGKMVAEYSNAANDTRPKGTSYLTADSLGSPRVVTDGGGNVIARHDYLPFGEENAANVGGRKTAHGYQVNDGVRQQFTGYERDIESGLDYAQARYFSSKHGRFTSVDPLTASANMKNPQTFNRYVYALNSPYKFTDPLGLAATSHCWGNICNTYDADEQSAKDRKEKKSENQEQDEKERVRPTAPPPPTIGEFDVWVTYPSQSGQIVPVNLPPEAIRILDTFKDKAWRPIWDNAVDNDFAKTDGSAEVSEAEYWNEFSDEWSLLSGNSWELGLGVTGSGPPTVSGKYGGNSQSTFGGNRSVHGKMKVISANTVNMRRARHQTITDAAAVAIQNLTKIQVKIPLIGSANFITRNISMVEASKMVGVYRQSMEQTAKQLVIATK